MERFDGTKEYGQLLQVDTDAALESMHVLPHVDADHGGDLRTGHSTSGDHAELQDDGFTQVPFAKHSKKQNVAAFSRTEAGYVALARGMTVTGLPSQHTVEALFGVPIKLKVGVDNKGAEAIAKSGDSKALKYLEKHQEMRRSFVRDSLYERREDRGVERVASKSNTADLLTKPMDANEHREYMRQLSTFDARDFARNRVIADVVNRRMGARNVLSEGR